LRFHGGGRFPGIPNPAKLEKTQPSRRERSDLEIAVVDPFGE
jgi:hypothetical protein